MRFFALIFVVLFYSARANQDSTKLRRFLVLPVIFKSPETGFATGISGAWNFRMSKDSLTRPSILQMVTLFTQRGQNVEAIDGTMYFPREKTILYLQSSHAYYPDKFWGLGPYTRDEWKEKYLFEQFYFFPHVKHKWGKHFFTGGLYEFQHVYNIGYTRGGAFDTCAFNGKSNYYVSGLGGSLSYDTRNAAYWPTKGMFTQLQYTGFNKFLLSDFNVDKIIFDTRFFKAVNTNQVIAIQVYSYLTFGSNPLRELAALGGTNNLRGIYNGRYRDKNFYSLIGEYRVPVYKRISCVVFGGLGSVFNNQRDIAVSAIKYSYGGGVRIALLKKEKLNFRIDYGYSDKRNNGLYFTVGECF